MVPVHTLRSSLADRAVFDQFHSFSIRSQLRHTEHVVLNRSNEDTGDMASTLSDFDSPSEQTQPPWSR
ncbi:hypothetical protein BCR33DRAFT_717196 [Rhizoclosmatium globosum]|uniref:Uncharacterized protein n=1 Tax=Rhizoclosmatium globosum TaxID=329046 RepID=A0A1Y2CAQ1_9FUNG|nr:hypothetical protein BCR33DRAFT_717196 [Rhizoclosmatium globosum]|eukprot:ORY44111.1 hypothetical protein BCR33DRAFT_717196 [Rhizoclosmatium globosum]